ncbi:MAG: sodium:proline symporter [Verrucomicrobia bacterium]|nr:sodium:proline symporter [Verrucomicrobiota bacterium]
MPNHLSLWVDGFVILVYFVVIVAIGLYAGRRNETLQEFALGGQKIPWWAVLASIIAAETSAATFLGAPAEGYKTLGFSYAQLAIGTILARILIAYLFIAPYFKFRVQSIYEYLTIRFGPRTKDMASGIFLLGRVLGIGVRLYLGGVILVVIWRYLFPGEPVTLQTYFWGIVFVTAVTTLYTAVGGIKAVVWTDLIQACLMCGAVLFAVFTILSGIPGGLATVDRVLDGRDVAMFQTGWDAAKPFGEALRAMLETPYTILAALLGATFLTMATHGTDQDMVQRMLTAENIGKSRFSLILSGFADIPIVLAFLAVGILLWVHYRISPDPLLPAAHNEIFAHYIVHEMPMGIRGLIVAGVFATMMGSTSAALNALATSFVRDFYQPYLNRNSTERESVRAARTATVAFGMAMILVATGAAYAVLRTNITIIPLALGVLSYGYGSLLGVFLLGIMTRRRGDDRANVAAMLAGIGAVLVLGKVKVPAVDLVALLRLEVVSAEWNFGAIMPGWWPAIAWPYFVFIGSVTTFALAVCFPTKTRAESAVG